MLIPFRMSKLKPYKAYHPKMAALIEMIGSDILGDILSTENKKKK